MSDYVSKARIEAAIQTLHDLQEERGEGAAEFDGHDGYVLSLVRHLLRLVAVRR